MEWAANGSLNPEDVYTDPSQDKIILDDLVSKVRANAALPSGKLCTRNGSKRNGRRPEAKCSP
jgi:hypothetical protein